MCGCELGKVYKKDLMEAYKVLGHPLVVNLIEFHRKKVEQIQESLTQRLSASYF